MGKYDQYRQRNNQSNFKYADVVEEFKNGKKGFASSVIGQGKEVVGQVYQGVKNIPKEEGLIRKTWGDFEKRAENINQNNATMQMGDRRTLRNAGQLLGAANDFIGNTFVSGIKTFVPKSLRESAKDVGSLALETKPGQMTKEVAKNAYTQWKAFEKSNPELAKDLGAVGNIANFALNFVGGSQAGKIKPTGLGDDILSNINRGVRNTAEKVSPTVQRMASKIPGQVDNLSTGAAEVGVSAATGLSREAQQIIKKQPGLYQQARQGTITREAVTDDVVGALSKRMDDISDLGKGYEAIRTSTITVPKNDIANIAVSHLDDMKVSKIDLPIGDRGTVQKALDYIRELPDTMTAQNALSLRRKFDDLINWKSEATGEGKRIIKGLRKKVDDYLGEKLPGLKDLDRKYGPEREFIDKVKGTILDKQGNLKDGAISSVANMIGKGKEMKLDRFEKLLPGIGDKVRALKAFEEIQNLAQIKTGSVARQIFSFAVGGIPGFVATNPYVVGYALEKYGFAKEAIKRILSKGKKISEAEAKAVHRAVKNVSRKEVEKIIAGKVGTPLLPAGKSSVATGNTGGKLPPADITPNASTGNAVSSQARISPPQTAGLLDSPKSTISETAQQVSTPVVKSPGNKVNTPIIPKSQPKAKLRTNEDALKKADDWTKKDFTKTTESKSVDKYGNTIAREQGKTSAVDSITVGGKKYTNLDIPDSSRTLYALDGKIYEYKNGKMVLEGAKPESKLPKTPQEGKTVDLVKEAKKYDTVDEFIEEQVSSPYQINKNPGSRNFNVKPSIKGKRANALDVASLDEIVETAKINKTYDKEFQQAVDSLKKSDGKVTIYRAAPSGKDININDYVALSKDEADKYMRVSIFNPEKIREGYKVYEKVVNKEDLIQQGKNSMYFTYLPKAKEIELRDIYKQANNKPSPLSQKSEVKYSKPDLVSEAKKYKSAEEFVKAQETLYHGTQAVKAKDYTAIESKMKEIYKKLGHEYKESDSVKIVGNAEELVAKRSNEKLSKVQSEIADLQELLSRKISKPSSKFAGSSNKDVRDNSLGSFLTPDRDFAGRFTYDISYDLAGRKTIQQKNGYLVENYFKGNTLDLSKASDYDLDFLSKTLNMPKKDIVAELRTKGGTKEIQKKLAPKKDIISKEYDAVSNYAYDSEAKKWKKEIAVINDESLYTKQQLLDIYNKANKK